MQNNRALFRVLGLVSFVLLLGFAPMAFEPAGYADEPGIAGVSPAGPASAPGSIAGEGVPAKVRDLLKALEQREGVPLPGYVGGRDFQNRERRLPRGRYREYDVNPRVPGRPRDAERIVIERRTGKAYYTEDHYRTFVPLN